MANKSGRLVIVGVGEDGLSEEARRLIEEADVVVGGRRHLAMAPRKDGQERTLWTADPAAQLAEMVVQLAEILTARRGLVLALASGDPMFYGIGGALAERLPEGARVIPAISSISLAAARLGWASQDVAIVSACGRPLEALGAELFDGARVFLLSADGRTPAAAARLLRERGFEKSEIYVLERLGGPHERIVSADAETLPEAGFADLNLLGIVVRASSSARMFSPAPGLPDEAYESDGQLTKREVRAATLARLSPRPGGLLWDIGAGSGSIAVEWMRAARRTRAVAIEAKPERAERIRRNAAALGVPGLTIVQGRAPEALNDLPPPDAVFIGGGLSEGVFDAAWSALKPRGRLVANVVTLEGEALLLDLWRRFKGDLTRIAVSRADPVGGLTGWRPLMPVTQWAIEKP